MKVRKAIIPAAGLGTRMRPFSRVVPKELVPLGTKPSLFFAVEEAAAAGIEEIVVVLSPGKELIRRALDVALAAGELPALGFEYVYQEEALGLAEAMALCRKAVCRESAAGEPFALLLPDNVFLDPAYRLRDLVDLFEETESDVVGILELDSGHSGRFGRSGLFEGETVWPERPEVVRIRRLHDKQAGPLEIPAGTSLRRTCGRYVCHPRVFEAIERLRPTVRGEYSEVPVYQRFAVEGGLLGHVLPAPPFDVGNPRGYLAACAHLHRQLIDA